jgi:uncharacterized membrane protein
MTYLIAGLVVFLGMHSIAIVASDWRDRMLARMGEPAWKGVYSVVSIVGFVLIIYGYGLARHAPVVLYSSPYWTHYVTTVLMLPVFPALIAAYFPGRIKAALKHPMLVAVKLWAFAHLLSNGMLADVLLFGSFLAWAVADRISMKRRPVRLIRTAPPRAVNDAIAVAAGLVLYAVFLFWLHAKWFGVYPIALP